MTNQDKPSVAEVFAMLHAGSAQSAEGVCIALCERAPDDSHAWFALGVCRHMLGQLQLALNAFDRALNLSPDMSEAVSARMSILTLLDRVDDAFAEGVAAVERGTTDPQLVCNTALLMERRDTERALTLYGEALRHAQEFQPALLNRGVLLLRLQRLEESLANNQRLVSAHPDFAEGHLNLAQVLLALDRAPAALAVCDGWLKSHPNDAKALILHGIAHAVMGRIEEAAEDFQRAKSLDASEYSRYAISADPGVPVKLDPRTIYLERCYQRQCRFDWSERQTYLDKFASWVRRDHGTAKAINDPGLAYQCLSLPLAPDITIMLARDIAVNIAACVPMRTPKRVARNSKKLRIAYISPDFREHLNAHLMLPVVRSHDRDRFEVFCYALRPDDESVVRADIARTSDVFRRVAEDTDAAVAAQIESDGIHLAIDLGGYTTFSRPGIFARRPAPVQVSYLAYPGTTGAGYIDYRVTDAVATPPEQATFWSERLAYLPHTFFPYHNSPRPSSITVTRGEYGLPSQAFVFCAFHNAYKIEPEIFDRWIRIMIAVPGSVIWLLDCGELANENLRAAAVRKGIKRDRLHFAPRESPQRYIARFNLADLFLDTHYFNAMTTACDALSAGLPLLTHPGTALPSRVATSLLKAADLTSLIAIDGAAYEQRAIELAGDLPQLGNLRDFLIAAHKDSTLFNIVARTRELESAYQRMWQRHIEGMPPETFSVPAY